MRKSKLRTLIGGLFHALGVVSGAGFFSLALFMVLPLLQAISKPPKADLMVQAVDTGELPTPDVIEEAEIEEEEEEEEPPELEEEIQQLDLSQLEMALTTGFNDGLLAGDFAVKLDALTAGSNNVDALFSLSDLDQRPRVIYQPSPMITAKVRKKAPGTVYVKFIVNEKGRVESPRIDRSPDPVFEKPALNAVKKWKFEPGKKNGKPVRFRMMVPVTFPKN